MCHMRVGCVPQVLVHMPTGLEHWPTHLEGSKKWPDQVSRRRIQKPQISKPQQYSHFNDNVHLNQSQASQGLTEKSSNIFHQQLSSQSRCLHNILQRPPTSKICRSPTSKFLPVRSNNQAINTASIPKSILLPVMLRLAAAHLPCHGRIPHLTGAQNSRTRTQVLRREETKDGKKGKGVTYLDGREGSLPSRNERVYMRVWCFSGVSHFLLLLCPPKIVPCYSACVWCFSPPMPDLIKELPQFIEPHVQLKIYQEIQKRREFYKGDPAIDNLEEVENSLIAEAFCCFTDEKPNSFSSPPAFEEQIVLLTSPEANKRLFEDFIMFDSLLSKYMVLCFPRRADDWQAADLDFKFWPLVGAGAGAGWRRLLCHFPGSSPSAVVLTHNGDTHFTETMATQPRAVRLIHGWCDLVGSCGAHGLGVTTSEPVDPSSPRPTRHSHDGYNFKNEKQSSSWLFVSQSHAGQAVIGLSLACTRLSAGARGLNYACGAALVSGIVAARCSSRSLSFVHTVVTHKEIFKYFYTKPVSEATPSTTTLLHHSPDALQDQHKGNTEICENDWKQLKTTSDRSNPDTAVAGGARKTDPPSQRTSFFHQLLTGHVSCSMFKNSLGLRQRMKVTPGQVNLHLNELFQKSIRNQRTHPHPHLLDLSTKIHPTPSSHLNSSRSLILLSCLNDKPSSTPPRIPLSMINLFKHSNSSNYSNITS
ncbi:hypothetical protein VP01_197g1 [Puccinia sorghi]|uniref:Uncharacterized protein n=1 Tax=Puccinia sorghi TaxID=27349 RepID=A0A0L6VBL8_9BASI|nr:hypothetical protein VP01_197g1 [Puccinia sorghi]